MHSLSDNFRIEGYTKSRNNTIFGLQSWVNCDDWRNSVQEQAFLQDLIQYCKSHQSDIKISNITFKGRITPDVPYALQMNGQLYQLKDTPSKKLIIFVHGFRMRQNHFTTIIPIQMLIKAFPNGEYDFLTVEYRNHGDSEREQLSWLTEKSYSTYGSLEYADVLGAIDYVKQHYGYEKIGLYGASMGGATILNVLLKSNPEDGIRALFMDSPACDIEMTLQSNLYRVLGYALGHVEELDLNSLRMKAAKYVFWPSVMLMGKILKPTHSHGGYAPFLNDPYLSLKQAAKVNNRSEPVALHFDHPTSDILVPMENSVRCSAVASQMSNFKVTTYYGPIESKQPRRTFTECKNHCVFVLSEPEKVNNRLVNFFKENL